MPNCPPCIRPNDVDTLQMKEVVKEEAGNDILQKEGKSG